MCIGMECWGRGGGRRRSARVSDYGGSPRLPFFPFSLASVSETSEVGSTVFSKVNVTDADFGMNGEVSLVCDSAKVSWRSWGHELTKPDPRSR